MVRIAKSWKDLTYEQRNIVENEADNSEMLMYAYKDDLHAYFEAMFDSLREKYADVFYTIERDEDGQWNIELEEGPIFELEFRPCDYKNKLWDYDEYFDDYEEFFQETGEYPYDNCTFTFSIVDIYPGNKSYLPPNPDYFEIEVFPDVSMFDSDKKLAKSILIDALRNIPEGKKVMAECAAYYTKPLEDIDAYETYILGGDGEFGFYEWLINQMHGGLRAIFEVDNEGNEIFVDFEWE